MDARYLAVFAAILAISCRDAGAAPATSANAKQNNAQPATASTGGSDQGGANAARATPNQPRADSAAADSSDAPHARSQASSAAESGTTLPTETAANPAADSGTTPTTASSAADSGTPPLAASPAPDAGPASDPAAAKASDTSKCPDGFPRGVPAASARKLLALKPSPEGVTMCPNGQVFLALDDGQIIRVDPDAPAQELWTTLTGIEPAGIACDEHNQLFIAVYAVRSGNTKPGVMRLGEQGAQGTMLPAPGEASPLAAYNGILAIAGQGVYATDSGAGWVVRTHENLSEIVARDIPIANGLAYDTTHRKLYVASSLDFAVYAFDLADDGSLNNRSQVKTSSSSFFDGVAVDENSEVYAADYSGNGLVRLSDAKVIATLPTPASLAFRGGTLLMTDYRLNQPDAEGGLYAVDLGACSGQRLQ